ncbi:DUF2058 family protein [Oligoflexus tunisiensis]|uniref:DUF2058 family protein n=1 Tax=Oligoflexus tunisiensis TaxID=708132 RepID=UPI000A87A73C|nr:DUF2058 family protein [Oligoflexus tunisiensis]
MSLRDQLLKSGLADKNQAKKAEKEAKKRQHQQLLSPDAIKDEISKEIAERNRRQQEADRERNRLLEEERRKREGIHRAMDIMVAGDLRESAAEIPYYFIHRENRISEILVTEVQQMQLAEGSLAIVSFDPDFRYFLVDASNAEKISSCAPHFVLCWHQTAA